MRTCAKPVGLITLIIGLNGLSACLIKKYCLYIFSLTLLLYRSIYVKIVYE